MIIPIGHEDTSVRRLPWVTFTIMILCVVVFLATLPATNRLERQANERLKTAVEYYITHPYLEPDPRLKRFLGAGRGEDADAALREVMKQFGKKPPRDPAVLKQQQQRLRRQVDDAMAAIDALPMFRLGLVPAHPKPLTFLTHMFMHAGWLHLLGNLFILYLTGPFVEDEWGRPLYAAFYLVSGVVAAVMFMLHYPSLEGPLIGASGAIAGVMGAFLILFWHRKIRFFYWIGIIFHGTFTAPAWLMLGLWFLRELVFAGGMDAALTGGGGVAYWAHVWGFAFGIVVAGGMRHFRITEKYIHPAIESKLTLVDNSAVDEAMEVFRAGDPERAIGLLSDVVSREPRNVDAKMALWNLCLESGQPARGCVAARDLMRSALREEDLNSAVAVWSDLCRAGLEGELDTATLVRFATVLNQENRPEEARQALHTAAANSDDSTPLAQLVRAARLAVKLGLGDAEALVARVVQHPEVPPEIRQELAAQRVEIVPPPASTAQEAAEEVSPPPPAIEVARPVARSVKAMKAVPLRLEPTGLVIRVHGAQRRLGHDLVQVVAVAGIRAEEQRPFLIIDLLLDAPWSDAEALRAVRLESSGFDPRSIMGIQGDPTEVLKMFLEELLRLTEATPLPDAEAARGRPFAMFPSIREYERNVLSVG